MLDLYAMHAVALPYYAGMLGRKPNGALAAVHLPGFRPDEMFERLAAFKPPAVTETVLIGLWGLYVVATLMLVFAAVQLGRAAGSRIEPAGEETPVAELKPSRLFADGRR